MLLLLLEIKTNENFILGPMSESIICLTVNSRSFSCHDNYMKEEYDKQPAQVMVGRSLRKGY